jgi:drug/metabolite transporter (DMT)-like permease
VAALVPLFAWDYEAGNRTDWNRVTVGAVLYFAVLPSVLAYYFWNAGVARVGAERASMFLHLMPLFGALLSWIFLEESLRWFHYTGALLIFSGIFLASKQGGPTRRVEAAPRRSSLD